MSDRNSNNLNAFGLQFVGNEIELGGDSENENKNENENENKNESENKNENESKNENENKNESENKNENESENKNENESKNENENENKNESKNENVNENKTETKVDVDVDVDVDLEGRLGDYKEDNDFADIDTGGGDIKGDVLFSKDGDVTYDPGDDINFKDILNGSMGANSNAFLINQTADMVDNDKLEEATVKNDGDFKQEFDNKGGHASAGDGIDAGGGGASGGKADGGSADGGNSGDAKGGEADGGKGEGGLALSAALGGDSKGDTKAEGG
ncbi:flagellar biosynthesis GTPase FlhF, partial [Aminobacter niigataensis]|nr:flagellar biosynthesis GTPase FlhF [Aminobacter niigataensis]